MCDYLADLGAFSVICPNCQNSQLYCLVDYPKEPVCKKCGMTFPLSETDIDNAKYYFDMFLSLERPDSTIKLKPLCLLLQKAIDEKKPFIRFYTVKDPSKDSSFPLLAVFAAERDTDESYSYIGSVKSW